MKIFLTSQIREIDKLTIETEPISSINLMERAADAIFRWFAENINSSCKVYVFAGSGNNGGDGLALARMLIEVGYSVSVCLLESASLSADCKDNLIRLKRQGIVIPYIINGEVDFPVFDSNSVIVDALFGSGLTRPLAGVSAKLVEYINNSQVRIVAIDMPSGLLGEENPFPNQNSAVKASITLTLQFPKLCFFFTENNQHVGKFVVLPIGLNPDSIRSTLTHYQYLDISSVSSIIRSRNNFSHKGDYGHCLIIAGSKGMMGASVLASTACIKTGSGLVTAHVPKIGGSIFQQSIPEIMVEEDNDDLCFTAVNSIAKYAAIAIGPGLGKAPATIDGFTRLIKNVKHPIIIDADALNIIAENQNLFDSIPAMSILTPHPREFDRLFGESESGYQRLLRAIEKAAQHNMVIVLKGAHTQIVCPDGSVFFNSTGNPGMATGGSGDVLTGIITSLLGQGYDSVSSSILGVYLHGLAGDLAAQKRGMESLTASDIIRHIGDAFNVINTMRK
ncbi:MAG: NAD(P)H-hydrate dehydratase [Bacteroidales bacterium]|nr:MAG: NAD(P)H-hydrate dehydratase [Bacteroidales bacterium]